MLHHFQNCLQSSTQVRPDNGLRVSASLRATRDLCFTVEVKLPWASALSRWQPANFYSSSAQQRTCTFPPGIVTDV